MKVKPFADPEHFTQVHNALLDTVMPALSPNAWKILSLVVRQTIGWQRKSHSLSYSAIKKGTGIKNDLTVRKALKELLKGDDKERLLDAVKGEDKWTGTSYGLNRKVVINWIPSDALSTTENVVGRGARPTTENVADSTTENVADSTTENVGHVMKEEKNLQKKGKKSSPAGAGKGKKSGSKSKPPSKPVPPADNWLKPYFAIFNEEFKRVHGTNYQTFRGDDCAALKRAKKTYEELFTEAIFRTASRNYVESPIGGRAGHRLRDMVGRFHDFIKGRVDEYGHALKETSNDNGKNTSKTGAESGGDGADLGHGVGWNVNYT